MQFIWAYDIFGFLCYIAVFVRWQQFGTYRSRQHIGKHFTDRLGCLRNGIPFDKVSYKSFGNSRIDSIHRHVVSVICSPAQCKLAEITRAYNYSAAGIRDVHQKICSLPGLCVLISDIVDRRIMPDVLEMLFNGWHY